MLNMWSVPLRHHGRWEEGESSSTSSQRRRMRGKRMKLSCASSSGHFGAIWTVAVLAAILVALICGPHRVAAVTSRRTMLAMASDRSNSLLHEPATDCRLVEYRHHGRMLLATNTSNYRPLAEKDNRIDPLDSFNKYRGGYDVKNKHYWASVVFTGIYGYAIAVAWLILGLLLLVFICCKCLCGKRARSKRPHSRAYYWAPRIIVFLFSAIAIGCSVVLYIAARDLNTQAYNVEDVLVEAAQNASTKLHSVSSSLSSAEAIVVQYSVPLASAINSTAVKLNATAAVVSDKVFVNKKTYQEVFKIIEIVLIVITSVNLVFILFGFASTFLRWRRFFIFIILLTWILTALTWAMFGLFLTIHNVADDTCLSLQEYLQDPKNTTLDDLLPCADLASTATQYLQVRKDMKDLIKSASAIFVSYTSNFSSVTGICDPIGPAPNYVYTGVCANDTIPLSELPSIIQPFVCNETRAACIKKYTVYVNQTTYNQINDMSTAGTSVLNAFPIMDSLTNCSVITNVLSIIVQERCQPAERAIDRIWIAFAVMSSVMVILIIFWCIANRRNTQQKYLATIIPQEQSMATMYTRPYSEMEKE